MFNKSTKVISDDYENCKSIRDCIVQQENKLEYSTKDNNILSNINSIKSPIKVKFLNNQNNVLIETPSNCNKELVSLGNNTLNKETSYSFKSTINCKIQKNMTINSFENKYNTNYSNTNASNNVFSLVNDRFYIEALKKNSINFEDKLNKQLNKHETDTNKINQNISIICKKLEDTNNRLHVITIDKLIVEDKLKNEINKQSNFNDYSKKIAKIYTNINNNGSINNILQYISKEDKETIIKLTKRQSQRLRRSSIKDFKSSTVENGSPSKININESEKKPEIELDLNALYSDIKTNIQSLEKELKEMEKAEKVAKYIKESLKLDLFKLEESIKHNKTSIATLKKQLYDHYIKLLNEGVDTRKKGYIWIILSIWKLGYEVPISSFPKSIDFNLINFLFIKSHKFKDLKDCYTNLTETKNLIKTFRGKEYRSSKFKNTINFNKQDVSANVNYTNIMYYKDNF